MSNEKNEGLTHAKIWRNPENIRLSKEARQRRPQSGLPFRWNVQNR